MAQAVLVTEQIDGGERIIRRLVDRQFPAAAAAWVKRPDDPWWHLHIVTPLVESPGPLAAYQQLGDALGELDPVRTYPTGRIDPFAIRLEGPASGVGQGILAEYGRYPGPGPTWQYSWLGSESIDEAYVYPPTLFQPQPQPAAG